MAVTCIRNTGVFPRWLDSAVGVWFQGKVHVIGGAIGALGGSKLHYVFDFDGTTLTQNTVITGPFTGTNEAGISLIKSGKIVLVGGTVSLEIWEFDPNVAGLSASSWSVIDSDFTPEIGVRTMSPSFDLGTYFYILGGWGKSDGYKTQNFTSWTSVTLPANLNKISAPAYCAHKGKGLIIGGATDAATNDSNGFYAATQAGYVYELNPSGDTFTLLATDSTKFGQVWPDVISDGTNLFYSSGMINSTGKNIRGIYKSTNDGVSWSSIGITSGLEAIAERHRACMVSTPYGILMLAGYGNNDAWLIT